MKHLTVREAVLNLIAAVERQQRPSRSCRMAVAEVESALARQQKANLARVAKAVAASPHSGRPRKSAKPAGK